MVGFVVQLGVHQIGNAAHQSKRYRCHLDVSVYVSVDWDPQKKAIQLQNKLNFVLSHDNRVWSLMIRRN